MEAEIITIGTEILLGEIVDTNTRTLARALRDIGLDIYRTSTVGDNASRIAQAIRESMTRSAAVITTGGLGPTVDDATREGVAMAFDVPTEFVPELWSEIETRFASFGRTPTENNRRQAHIPLGAIPISNPVGTAPAFISEGERSCVISLPGVPGEMVYLLENDVIPYLRKRLGLRGTIKSRILRTAGLGESLIDKRIEDLERLSNPTVGLSAHPGRVDIRITAKAGSEIEADQMIWSVEATLQQRLGDHIYGADGDTLESVLAGQLAAQSMTLCILEYGTRGALSRSLASFSRVFLAGQLINQLGEPGETERRLRQLCHEQGSACGLALLMIPEEEGYQLTTHTLLGEDYGINERSYAGRFVNPETLAVSIALERLRRKLLEG